MIEIVVLKIRELVSIADILKLEIKYEENWKKEVKENIDTIEK
jgi:hypothetical protein